MNDKKQTLIMIIITGALILIAAGITYAYFTAGGVSGKETVSTVLVTGGRLEIEYENLSNVITVNNIYPRNDEWVTKNFKVTGTNTTDLKMKYKVGIEVSSSTFNDSELTYSLTNTRVDSGTAISNITSEGLPTSGTKWFGTGSFVNGTSQVHSYTFKLYFKDNNTNQNGAQEKTMTSKIVIEEDGTIPSVLRAKDFTALLGESGNGSLYQDAYGNLRYDGLNPNNYATFNGENWRVIGVFELPKVVNGVASTTETEKRIKLIREDSIGNAYYHASSNVWSTSLIAAGLANSANGTAYGDNGATGTKNANLEFKLNDAAKSLISPAVWYVGASDNRAIAKDVYDAEHDSSTNPWTGKMGLMSASDYGFASSSCKGGSQTLYDYDNSSCTGSNWLKKGINEWTMIPHSDLANLALNVRADGFVRSGSVAGAFGLRPVIYLNSDVQVRGTGTSGDRYTFK